MASEEDKSLEAQSEAEQPPPERPNEEMPDFPADMRKFMGASLQMMGGPPTHPLEGKITSDHITALIEGSLADAAAERTESRHSKLIYVLFAGFAMVLLVGLILALVILEERDLVRELGPFALAFATGVAGGYGIGYAHRSRTGDF